MPQYRWAVNLSDLLSDVAFGVDQASAAIQVGSELLRFVV